MCACCRRSAPPRLLRFPGIHKVGVSSWLNFFFFKDTAPTEIYTLSLHDALPISAVATFGELWTAIVPAAVPPAPLPPGQLDREVGWVRVLKARVPAFDALDPGDLAIVPGSALA